MNLDKTPMAPFEDPRDLEFQHQQWVFERISSIALAVVVILAVLGVFGSGPLDAQSVRTSKLDLEYGRFLRREAPNDMRLTVRPSTLEGFTLSFDRQYLESNSPESIDPEPTSRVLKADHVELRFASKGPGPFVIIMHLRPTQTGPLSGTLRLEFEQTIALSQFVYP